jgi:hypothetical protein
MNNKNNIIEKILKMYKKYNFIKRDNKKVFILKKNS